MVKYLIYYHRAYRKISGSLWLFLLKFLLATIPVIIIILFYYPEITKLMSLIVRDILSSSFAPGTLEIVQKEFLLEKGNIFLLIAPGSNPSIQTSFISSLVMLILVFFLQRMKIKNMAIFAAFLAVIHMISAIFFTLVPYLFPYTLEDFAELYVKTLVCIWLFIPCILAMAILPLPSSFIPKFILIILTLIYSFIFATLRYAIFIYLLSKFSSIYMALLFFAFGPLIDFVYVVGIYAVFTTYLAKKLKSNELIWEWLY